MFYVCEQNGNKFGVKDLQDGSVEYYTAEELLKINETVRIFGVFKKTGECEVIDLSEYQALEDGNIRFFSFVDKIRNDIFIGLEMLDGTYKAYSLAGGKCYLNEADGMIPIDETNKNGNLEWIFKEGVKTKCYGVCIWLSFSYANEDNRSWDKAFEVYVEVREGRNVVVIHRENWNFNERGAEYIYDEEKDCIGIRYV